MRTVTLEFLRQGPAHNQLLSPLTPYLALCGNHQTETVKIPFEHAELMIRLRALSFRDSAVTRELQVADTAQAMANVLAQVPGLIRELADSPREPDNLIHLRLVLSANELALLPFELANAPSGCPGVGQPIALQSQMPLCITREVRRVSADAVIWPPPPNPKILLAAASAGGEIPLEAHVLTLRRAIEPWMMHYEDEAERRRRIDEHLTVLPRASVDSLEAACASDVYTHVHLLAHGVPMPQGEDRRFGLALHKPYEPGEADVVSADRLATLLRTAAQGREGFTRPMVVTIAACDSGNVGSVVGAGASIAHALHEAGVPLVVASQFPLSFAGSVVMTEVLYEGLLWGVDPRFVLSDLRRQLKTRVPECHDWASVVAYASFPTNLEQQLPHVRMRQAYRSLEAALNHADRAVRVMSTRLTSTRKTTAPSLPPAGIEQLRDPEEKLSRARQVMQDLLGRERLQDAAAEALYHGLVASADKRLAEILWRASRSVLLNQEPVRTEYETKALESLRKSLDSYWQAFRHDRSQAWAVVQALALTAVLNGLPRVNSDHWELARILSEQDLRQEDRQRRAWAYSNLMELALLAILMGKPLQPGQEDWPTRAEKMASELLQVADRQWVEVHSTRRQLLRYVEFFNEVAASFAPPVVPAQAASWANLVGLVEILLAMLPESPWFS